MKRIDIDNKYKWQLDVMIENINFNQEMENIRNIASDFSENKKEYCNNVENLFQSIDAYHKIWRKSEYIYVYVHHKLDEDLGNQDIQKLEKQVSSFIVDIDVLTSFYIPLLNENIDFIKENINDEKLMEYRNFLNDLIRSSKYVMSNEVENVLSLLGEVTSTASNIYSKFMNVDLKFNDILDEKGNTLALDTANYSTYMQSQDKVLRDNAYNEMYNRLSKYNETITEIYISEIQKDIFVKRLKGYDSLRQKSLFHNKIPEEIYDNLIKVVNENMVLHNEYLKIRKDKMGLKKLQMSDLYPSLHETFDKKINYEEAQKITLEALKPLGDDYISKVKEYFNNQYIDVYPNGNKRSGAYSGGCYDSPAFILLNYTDTLNDVYTLVHEIGHSMHTNLSNATQSYTNSKYKIFVAEIASTLNELLLTDYLFENAQSNEEKKYILNYKLEQYKATVFRQTMFAEFEHESKLQIEKSHAMNSSELNDMYLNLVNKYFAEVVDVDENIKYEWMRIPHFYYNYYVYQYATSFCAAVDIYYRIKEDSQMIEKYLNFLSLGSSVSSMEALKTIDIDFMKTTTIENAMKDFKNTLNLYKEL